MLYSRPLGVARGCISIESAKPRRQPSHEDTKTLRKIFVFSCLGALVARKRDVKVGQRTGLAAEILSGLAEGEAVISQPDKSIEDGTRVRPR